jgi:Uncharacterized conserved protein
MVSANVRAQTPTDEELLELERQIEQQEAEQAEAKKRAEAEAKRKAEDEAKQKAEEKRLLAEEEAKRKAEEEAKKKEALLAPGKVFRDKLKDGSEVQEMVIIPAGSFTMGSSENEIGHRTGEGPQHLVTFAYPFAIGKYEVTFEEYDRFALATGRPLPIDEGWAGANCPSLMCHGRMRWIMLRGSPARPANATACHRRLNGNTRRGRGQRRRIGGAIPQAMSMQIMVLMNAVLV